MRFNSAAYKDALIDLTVSLLFFTVCAGLAVGMLVLLRGLIVAKLPPDFAAGLVGGILWGFGAVWVKNRFVEAWRDVGESLAGWKVGRARGDACDRYEETQKG